MMNLPAAKAIIASARQLVIFTGAGVSADSGVPTFRGSSSDALWGKYDPRTLASPEGFSADPQLVYDWYNWRRSQLAKIVPNAAHHAIATLQMRGATIITQNVDGLHERVAPSNATILRLHGTILEDRCNGCLYREPIDLTALPPLRACPRCGDALRPAVVWFGESLDGKTLSDADRTVTNADAMLVVGTSGTVWPAAGFVHQARTRGIPVIIVNAEPSDVDSAGTHLLLGRAAEIVPQLVA